MTLLYALAPLVYVAIVEAQGGGGGDSDDSVSFSLEPLDLAYFIVSIVIAVLSFLQLIFALSKFGSRPAEDDYPRRTGAVALLTLTTMCTTTSWALDAYEISQKSPTATGGFVTVGLCTTVGLLLFRLSSVLFLGTMFVILDWRTHQQAVQYGHRKSKRFATIVRYCGLLMLLVLLACTCANAGILGSYYTSMSRMPVANDNAMNSLSHVSSTFFIITNIAIFGTTIVLWTNKLPNPSTLEITQFDDRVLKRILCFICPLLALQAIYKLIAHIFFFLPSRVIVNTIDLPSFVLANTVIVGLFFLFLVGFALNLGIRPKKERQAEQVRAGIKAQEVSPSAAVLITATTANNLIAASTNLMM